MKLQESGHVIYTIGLSDLRGLYVILINIGFTRDLSYINCTGIEKSIGIASYRFSAVSVSLVISCNVHAASNFGHKPSKQTIHLSKSIDKTIYSRLSAVEFEPVWGLERQDASVDYSHLAVPALPR